MERRFIRYRHERCPERVFHFEIVLPEKSAVARSSRIGPERGDHATLALFAILDEHDEVLGEIDVTCVRLARDVRPADWLEVVLPDTCREIAVLDRAETPAGAVADVRATSTSRLGETTIRATAIKDGDLLFVIGGRALRRNFALVEQAIDVAFGSFRLLGPTRGPSAEDLHRYGRREPLAPLFYHPAGFEASHDATSTDVAIGAHLRDPSSEASPFVGVYRFARAASDDEPQRVAERAREVLSRRGIDCAPVELRPAAPRNGFTRAWQAASAIDGPGELHLAVFQHPRAWCLVMTSVQSREAFPADWMRGRRVHDVVSQTLRIVHG